MENTFVKADIVDFNFTGNNGTTDPVSATFVATNLATPVQITRVGPDITAMGMANSFSAKNWPTSTSIVTSKDYFSFTIAATSGHAIDLLAGGMTFNLATMAMGTQQFAVRSSLDNFATNISTPFTPSMMPGLYSFSFAPYLTAINVTLPVSTPIEFRMYGYDAKMTNQQMWFNSSPMVTNAVQVTGTIVPVPEPTLVFTGTAVATGLAWFYRRLRRPSPLA